MSARPLRRLVGTGLLATLAAAVATTLAAAMATGLGVAFEVPDGGETIPLSGIAFVTAAFSVLGVIIAAALLKWSSRPADHFVRTTVALTALSLLPPWLVDASAATSVALVALHLVAATVMVPGMTWCLRGLEVSQQDDLGAPQPVDRLSA